MLRIVQVGVGGFTNMIHGPMLQQYAKDNPGELEFAAVCVRKSVDKAREYCQKYGFGQVYTDIDEMVRTEKPDACWALTNPEGTRKVAGRMMELGIPVLFEKPPGKNLNEAMELAEVSRQTGTSNMVAFNRRFAPCTQKAMEWARDHGPFARVSARMIRAGRKEPDFAYNTGIHALDCLHMLADICLDGMKTARVQRVETPAGGFDFHVDMTFGSGATGQCDLTPNCGVNDETYSLFGNNKCITFSLPWIGTESKAELWEGGKLLDSERWPAESAFRNFGVYQESAAFIEAIRDGRKPHPSAEQIIESVALTEAVAAGRNWQSGLVGA